MNTNWVAAVSSTAALPATNQSNDCIYLHLNFLIGHPLSDYEGKKSVDASVSLFYSLACRVFESQYFKGQF